MLIRFFLIHVRIFMLVERKNRKVCSSRSRCVLWLLWLDLLALCFGWLARAKQLGRPLCKWSDFGPTSR